ncbi:BrnT family toxin [Candidatus Poribacteria bacterium]|nr:BrnT family toxin [Candidatus Poribacteria bacterium]
MQIDDIIWLPQFVEKLERKHRVTTEEVEEVFVNRPRFRFLKKGQRPGEDVYAAMGQTHAGRYLIIYFILKPRHRVLIVSARDVDGKERRRYAKK